jgi:soluble cytochrome b562
MATASSLPSSPLAGAQNPPTAPPNFYAQAASAQPASPAGQSGNSEDTTKFRTAIEKLVTIFDKIEKMKPNGIDISKKVKAVAQSLKDLKTEVFEGEEGEGADDTDLGSGKAGGAATSNAATGAVPPPPPAATGGVAGTGA